jgi:alpha-tubulin suppressor-like RCC1 family protein
MDGAVFCAGDNAEGQLGTGATSGGLGWGVVGGVLWSLGIAKSVHTGRQFTCVRDVNGRLFCLGDNADLQLGASTPGMVSATHVANGAPPMSPNVSLGNAFGCGVSLDDHLWCWGDGDEGQAGTALQPDSHLPQVIGTINNAGLYSLSAGTDHACSGYLTNRLVCWGAGTLFRLGYNPTNTCTMATAGSIPCQTQPIDLMQTVFAGVSAGHEHSCATTTFGDVRCWGSNDRSQLGEPPSTMGGLTVIPGITSAVEVAAGRHFNCARDAMGRVFCWGAADLLQLGRGVGGFESATPLEVVLPHPANAIVTHPMGEVACALLDDGTASCWGANDFGQLGRGASSTEELPGPFTVPCD